MTDFTICKYFAHDETQDDVQEKADWDADI